MNLFQKKHDWILGGFEFLHVDNVTADAGTGGAVFATDDIGGIHYPRSKVVWGADGAVNDTSAAAPLPVVQTGTPALPTGASTAAKQPAIGTAGTASADVITVQGAASMTALLVNGSAVTQPVSDAGGSLTTDSAQLPATLGQKTMAASMAVALASDQASIPVTGTFFQAAQPVTDNGGLLSVDDGAGTLTVDAPVGTPVFVRLSDGTAAIATLPVSLASVPSHAVTNAGTFAVQSTAQATTNTQEVVGDAAHDAVIAGNPNRIAARAMTADYTAVASGDVADILSTVLGKQVMMPYALPANFWSYAAPAGGLVTTTGVTAKAAGAAGVRHYITSVQVVNSHATISSEVLIRDGAAGTVLHRGWAQAAGGGYACKFDPPLRGTAATLVEIGEVTATATAGILVNLQGYSGIE